MVEFEVDWMFFIVLFIMFITAGLVTGKNQYEKKLEKDTQVERDIKKDKYHELERRIKILEKTFLKKMTNKSL